MRFISKILMLCIICLYHVNAKEIALYPVYSRALDNFTDNHVSRMFFLEEEMLKVTISPCFRILPENPHPIKFGKLTVITVNLNNILKFQDDIYNLQERYVDNFSGTNKEKCDADPSFRYNFLGKITIDDNDKLHFDFFTFDDRTINKKIFELKKSISFINDNNFTMAQKEEILNVDLLEEQLGEELYQSKQLYITTKKATSNLINCRFCKQVIQNIQYHENTPPLLTDFYEYQTLLFNNQEIKGSDAIIKFLNEIQKKGSIYNQLDPKYIAKSYDEWEKIVDKEKLNK